MTLNSVSIIMLSSLYDIYNGIEISLVMPCIDRVPVAIFSSIFPLKMLSGYLSVSR